MSWRPLPPLSRVYDWLARTDPLGKADLIFVLAGRQGRKAYALRVFREGKAPRILLSTARFEIRRFANLSLPAPLDLLRIASVVPPPQRHFFVYFEGSSCQVDLIPVARLGTLSELDQLASWLRARPNIRSVLVVSSGAHLRRVRMCCRALLPTELGVRLISAPEEAQQPGQEYGKGWAANAEVFVELFKLLVYRIVLVLRAGGTSQK
jgi:uncharacterized SAM-binding protein YcdF (DUF218 family)